MFAAVTSTTSKNVLKFKPRFIKLSNMIDQKENRSWLALRASLIFFEKNFQKKLNSNSDWIFQVANICIQLIDFNPKE